MADALPTSSLVQFGNPADPTADQRRSSSAGIKIFTALLGLPWAIAIAGVVAMCMGLFAGMLEGWSGKIFGFIAALCVALGVAGLPVASAYAFRNKEPAVGWLALIFFIPFVLLASFAAYGFGSVLGFNYPQISASAKTVRFDDEPGQIRAIDARMEYWIETPRPYREDSGRPIRATGREILNMTSDCSRPRQAFERSQCDEFSYLQAEKRARIECESGERIKNCGKTRLTLVSVTETPGPFTKADYANGKRLAANSAPGIAVAVTAGYGLIFLWIAYAFMNVKNEVPAMILPDAGKPEPEPEVVDHFDAWDAECVKKDPSQSGLKFQSIWKNYKAWCRLNGHPPRMTERAFSTRMASEYAAEHNHSGGSIYNGLRLKTIV